MQLATDLAEQGVLGVCMANTKAPLLAASKLSAVDFERLSHRRIFDVIMDLVAEGMNAEPRAVAVKLGTGLDDIGLGTLEAMVSTRPRLDDFGIYLEAVRDAALDRRIRALVDGALGSAEGAALADTLREGLFSLETTDDSRGDFREVWDQMKAQVPLSPGCSYPWSEVQNATRGMRPGWLCVLAGETSHGKTAAALAITRHVLKSGKVVAYISLEMNREQLGVRLAQAFGFDSGAYFTAGIAEGDNLEIIEAIADFPYWKNLYPRAVKDVGEVSVIIQRLKPDLVVVDHLHLLAGTEETKTLTVTTRQLKVTAERFQVPILCLAQLNRGPNDGKEHPLTLSRLRNSGSIEQDADTVLFTFRRVDKDTDGCDTGNLTDDTLFKVLKSRMGYTKGWRVRFNGATQEFTFIDNVHSQEPRWQDRKDFE